MGSLLKTGRIEAIVHGLWDKMVRPALTCNHHPQCTRSFNTPTRTHLEQRDTGVLAVCAGGDSVPRPAGGHRGLCARLRGPAERGDPGRRGGGAAPAAGLAPTWCVALNVEVRNHSDANGPLFAGSTPIEPIAKELRRLEDEAAEVRTFLSMPQQRPLREQLDEAGQLIDGTQRFQLSVIASALTCCVTCSTLPVLSHRVFDISTALGRAGMRLELLEVNTHQLDTRLALAESLRERVDRLHRLCDCSGRLRWSALG